MADPIAVNLITGFLGSGKTTTIRRLLQTHPRDQKWAVLVNEFGEIGIDGALLDADGVAVQEVAGGCLCCVAAPAFTTGLNRLIRRKRPDRILIEPSGLGHPAQVIETLTGPLYRDILDVRATLCILDARHLSSPRHREHAVFADQIHLADVLVANKADLYSAEDELALEQFLLALDPPKTRVTRCRYGDIDPALMDVRRDGQRRAAFPEAHAFLVEAAASDGHSAETITSPWLLIEGSEDGYQRASWTIEQQHAWPKSALEELLSGLPGERVKGLFRTDHGWMAVNDRDWSPITEPDDSRARLVLIDCAKLPVSEVDRRLRLIEESARTSA
ncbi:MAG: GTP-binding protein [Gammaproteobacteria bacterium]|nr:GTP-binding protein [Gammaproteobacteria bacterium]